VFATIRSSAQIVYTDVNPDQTFADSGAVYHLDLNNDGVNDFDILDSLRTVTLIDHCFGLAETNRNILIKTSLNNDVLSQDGSPYLPYALNLNDTIRESSSSWSNLAPQFLKRAYWICVQHRGCDFGCIPWQPGEFNIGLWTDTSDKYLGLKLVKGNDAYYGWVRLSVNFPFSGSVSSFTVKDYAYNNTPNMPILAGEKTTVLAVTLFDFKAASKNNGIELTWSTGSEVNCKGFEIEKSTDGKTFFALGFVNGKGNSSPINQYSFTDADLKNEHNFYRLKQVDINGNFSYSKVIQINYSNSSTLTIAPNPLSGSTTISFDLPQSQKVSLQIFDIEGRLIKVLADAQMQAGAHQFVWNAKNEKGITVQAGIYFLRMRTEDYAETRKLVVVK
jgi:hypothetical protein